MKRPLSNRPQTEFVGATARGEFNRAGPLSGAREDEAAGLAFV